MNSTLGWVKAAECVIGELGEGDGVDEEVETDAESRSEPWLAEPGRGHPGTSAISDKISPRTEKYLGNHHTRGILTFCEF